MFRRPARALAIAALCGGITTAVVPPAASATEYASFNFANGVLYSGCFDYAYSFNLDLPDGTEYWSIDVSITSADGTEVGSDYVYGTGRVGTLTSEVFLCGSEDAGALTATGVVDGEGDEVGTYSLEATPQTFIMRRPFSQTTAKVVNKPECGKVIKIAVTAADERPTGYFPADFAEVGIQQFYDKKWQTLRGTVKYVSDNGTGKAIVKVLWTRFKDGCQRLQLRGITLRDTDYRESSHSSTLNIK